MSAYLTRRGLLAGAAAGVAALAVALGTPSAGAGPSGRVLFVANCASCHTLKAAHAHGRAGPNLDRVFRRTKRSRVRRIVLRMILRGTGGTMPPGILGGADAPAVADYVARHTGRP